MHFSRASALLVLAALCACVAATAATAKTSGSTPPTAQNTCPIVDAAGNLGGGGSSGQTNVSSTGTAGGVALGAAKALGSLVLDCENYSNGLTITAPGHTFSTKASAIKCQSVCLTCKAQNRSTLACKLSESEEKIGIKAVGSWQATINWLYAANDEAATNTEDGSCHITVKAVLTVGGKQNFSGKDLSVCAYAKGDALQ
jgi:hypothetical protein